MSYFCLSNCVAHNEFDLEKVLKSERKDVVIMEIGTYLKFKTNFGKKINKLNDFQKALFYIECLNFEVNNGGFHEFFANYTGDFSNKIIEAISVIEAYETFETVRKANEVFNLKTIPENQSERQKVMKQISIQSEAIWNKCDEEFYSNSESLSELLFDFVLKNKPDFVR